MEGAEGIWGAGCRDGYVGVGRDGVYGWEDVLPALSSPLFSSRSPPFSFSVSLPLSLSLALSPQLFLEVGNKNANSFWAATLTPEDELQMGASAEQRATFHRRKYRERKFRRVLEALGRQADLNKVTPPGPSF